MMREITITTNKLIPGPHGLDIWAWEVPVYLFLGGLAAGLLILACLMIIRNKSSKYSATSLLIIPAIPVLISVGMTALFLDLSHKLYVWRFYTAFKPTSVMSWGAWILVFIYPLSFLLIAATYRKSYPALSKKIDEQIKSILPGFAFKTFEWIINFSETRRKGLAKTALPFGLMLGVYTGVLLSNFVARPFWNSSVLGPLFLVSGISTGAAFILLFSKEHVERLLMTKIDITLIITEIVLIAMYIMGLLNSTESHQNAVKLILGGSLTPVFWSLFFVMGLVLPGVLEIMELKGKKIPALLPAVMILIGGLVLRFIITHGGQITFYTAQAW
jgi:protein NrfD